MEGSGSDEVSILEKSFWLQGGGHRGKDWNECGQTFQQMNAVILVRDGANLKQSNVGGHGAKQVDVSNNGEVKTPGLSDRRP